MEALIYFAGDVAPYREDPVSIFKHVKQVLSGGDLSFCQLEANLSSRGKRLPHVRATLLYDPKIAKAIKEAGFRIVSFASNHCMDWGEDAFFDTIENLKREGIKVVGVGKNIDEAREPVYVKIADARIAFLAYNSILPEGFWADKNRPGCVPLRAYTLYEQVEPDQPGTPCRILTFPREEDLKEMVTDIKKVKANADIVIVSMHWGVHFIPYVIADYQRIAGHVAIDSGADLIIGTHAHILKGVEVYRDKAIFYSLGNFALELPEKEDLLGVRGTSKDVRYGEYRPYAKYDPEYRTYPFHPEARKTGIVKCVISDKKIKSVSFLPCYIDKTSEPKILDRSDERFNEVVNYLESANREAGISASFRVEGNEVVVWDAKEDFD